MYRQGAAPVFRVKLRKRLQSLQRGTVICLRRLNARGDNRHQPRELSAMLGDASEYLLLLHIHERQGLDGFDSKWAYCKSFQKARDGDGLDIESLVKFP